MKLYAKPRPQSSRVRTRDRFRNYGTIESGCSVEARTKSQADPKSTSPPGVEVSRFFHRRPNQGSRNEPFELSKAGHYFDLGDI
jgi:hypothetical protein